MTRVSLRTIALAAAAVSWACRGGNTAPQGGTTPGADRTAKTAVLETGADLVQAKAPVEQIAMYLNGFHVSKDDPTKQMEAQIGLEYIIAERLYATLTGAEKAYWHPHNYEVLSGQLHMPGLPDAAEKEALKGKVNSYGKTWHTWMAGLHGQEADPLPFGPAHLQWSFNRDGEAVPAMVSARDARFDFNTADERQDRQDLVALAKPQGGVDAMAPRFPGAKPTAGVIDNGDAAARPVPTIGLKDAEPEPSGR